MKFIQITSLMIGMMAVTTTTVASAGQDDEVFIVAYKLAKPTTIEFDDPGKAKAHAAALTKLGCKSKSESHEGHIDVTYQQPRWTAVTVGSEELVHKWQDWLIDAGFETLHSEDPEHEAGHDHGHQHEGVEVIAYQMKDWGNKHFEQAGTSDEFIVVCKALGCEIKEDVHDGHADIQFRCLKARHIECPSHEAAEARAEWLTKLGFSVKHEH